MAVVEFRQRRDLLNLWATTFAAEYKPDTVGEKAVKDTFSSIILCEMDEGWKIGSIMVADPWVRDEPKIPLYDVGELLCRQWGVPMTQYGLVSLLLGCMDGNDVRALLAYVYKQYTITAPKDHLLDATAVSILLEDGMPSRGLFNRMWELQKIERHRIVPERNLLDILKPEDFKTA